MQVEYLDRAIRSVLPVLDRKPLGDMDMNRSPRSIICGVVGPLDGGFGNQPESSQQQPSVTQRKRRKSIYHLNRHEKLIVSHWD